jgi:hypothetical protein
MLSKGATSSTGSRLRNSGGGKQASGKCTSSARSSIDSYARYFNVLCMIMMLVDCACLN